MSMSTLADFILKTMTDHAPDPAIEKLASLRRCLARVETRRAASADELARDPDRQDILSLNLTRAVQLCVDMALHVVAARGEPVPLTMGEAFDRLAQLGIIGEPVRRSLHAAVELRRVAIHDYRAIDWTVAHDISHQGLGDFHAFAAAMDGLLKD